MDESPADVETSLVDVSGCDLDAVGTLPPDLVATARVIHDIVAEPAGVALGFQSAI